MNEFLKHLEIEDKNRDKNWDHSFLNMFPKCNISIAHDLPQQGSDGMPYMLISSSKSSKEPATKLLSWAHNKGVGIVLNPDKDFPDFIFTYGMIWLFKETGRFLAKPFNINTAQKLAIPSYVRSILRQFFLDQGVYQAKFSILKNNKNTFDICFCANSLGDPPQSEHTGILKTLSWFLPQHYPIAIVKNTNVHFETL